jgi:hypothetical protein
LTAFDGRIIGVEVQQRGKLPVLAGINPIDDYADSVEAEPIIRHGYPPPISAARGDH